MVYAYLNDEELTYENHIFNSKLEKVNMEAFGYFDGLLVIMTLPMMMMAVVFMLYDAAKQEPLGIWRVVANVVGGVFIGMLGAFGYWMLTKESDIKPSNMLLLLTGSHAATFGIASVAVRPGRVIALTACSLIIYLALTAIILRKSNL